MQATAGRYDTSFFGHPRGLATLFLTELWERFSYYGMRALLILFMTAPAGSGGLGFAVAKAGAIYGLYTAMVYMVSLPGGWLADRYLGLRRAVLYGGVLIALGNAGLVVPGVASFYTGLALIVAGTGLLKPNVSALVGKLYEDGDNRRDSGFSIYYMGINLGAFLAPLACGYAGQRINWHLGFALAAAGMVLGVIQFARGQKHLGGAGAAPSRPEDLQEAKLQDRCLKWAATLTLLLLGALGLTAATGLVAVDVETLSDGLGLLLLAITAAFFVWLLFFGGWTPPERKRLFVAGVLFLASALFWCVFEQAGSTLNLFAQRSTDKTVLGFTFPASWLQSLNALFIISLAPAFAWLWLKLGPREPSSPTKFVLGLLAAGAGFLVLAPAAARAETGVLVSPLWLVAVYFLHTIGELCLSPVGLSAMTKLAPARISGLLMGVWFLSISLGNYLGGRLASLYESLPLPRLFLIVAGFGIASGLILALFVRPTKKLMGGVK